ncbi:hypothetical protein LguiB_012508 [Lonicera macranthoides]
MSIPVQEQKNPSCIQGNWQRNPVPIHRALWLLSSSNLNIICIDTNLYLIYLYIYA